MKATRADAARMHSARLTVVRRSSSMIPIFTVLAGQAEHVLDPAEHLVGEGHLGGAVHLRLDDVHRAGSQSARGASARRSWHGAQAR